MTLSISNLFSARCKISTQRNEFHLREFVWGIVIGLVIAFAVVFYIQYFTFTEPVIKHARMGWNEYDTNFGQYVAKHFGNKLILESSLECDYAKIIKVDGSIKRINNSGTDFRPFIVK